MELGESIQETILVTGGAGFIGSHLCERLLKDGKKVVCIDNFNDYYSPLRKEENVKGFLNNSNFKLYRADICDFSSMEKVFLENKFSAIIHLAARAGVRYSIENPKIYFETNVTGTENLLKLCLKYKVKKFIFGSSSSVYGTNKKVPFSEEDEIVNQISPYAVTKKQAEDLCKKYSSETELNITVLRFFTVYGPRGRPDMAPYKFVESILHGKPINIFVSEKDYNNGKMARDFTFVSDIVEGIVLSLQKNFKFEIFNLGRGEPIKLNTYISIIEKLCNKTAVKKFIGEQEGDVPITYSDTSKAKKLLGYNPKISVEEGMGKLIDWYLDKK